ncbi:MAG: amino acid adenylation domain-containing protein [Thermoleophilia bacterium]|nr:amino acid adenylation domain-containing protein [Thermoleophilia bacterium]
MTDDGRARPATDLGAVFTRTAERHPDAPALAADGAVLTYAELHAAARDLAGAVRAATPRGAPEVTGVLARRSVTAFVGLLAALLAGHTHLPLNPAFPPARTRDMLRRGGARVVVVDADGAAAAPGVLDAPDPPVAVIAPDLEDPSALGAALRGHTVTPRAGVVGAGASGPTGTGPDPGGIAYLLFTSGTTGTPKGVGITHANIVPLVTAAAERYGIGPGDRVSVTAEPTFDAGLYDTFLAWAGGACAHCLPRGQLIKPGRFIRDAALTVWDSVPSIALFMRRLGALKPNAYPSLRLSIFGGEALPEDLARAWAAAAPRSVLENHYGPTEVTVECLVHRWSPRDAVHAQAGGIVPIGRALPGLRALAVDASLAEVPPGAAGELLIAGHQVAPGDWDQPEATARRFVVPPGRTERFYRTGDRVRRPDGDEPFLFLGRLDDQVQVLGNRVELAEVERAARDLPGVDDAAAVGWPVLATGVGGIVCFATGGAEPAAMRVALAAHLPGYMVPVEVRMMDAIPRTTHGKTDRRALLALLDGDPG